MTSLNPLWARDLNHKQWLLFNSLPMQSDHHQPYQQGYVYKLYIYKGVCVCVCVCNLQLCVVLLWSWGTTIHG